MMLHAAILYGSLRWELLKNRGQHHKVQFDVGPELTWQCSADNWPNGLLSSLHDVPPPWSACLRVGEALWAVACIHVPAGEGHPRTARELIALQVLSPALIKIDEPSFTDRLTSFAKNERFDIEDLTRFVIEADPEGARAGFVAFSGSSAAQQSLADLFGAHLPGQQSESAVPKTRTLRQAGARIQSSIGREGGRLNTQADSTVSGAGRGIRFAVVVLAIVVTLQAVLIGLIYSLQLDDERKDEFAKHAAVVDLLEKQKLELQRELLNDRTRTSAALDELASLEEVRLQVAAASSRLDERVGDVESSVTTLQTSLDRLRANVDPAGTADEQAKKLRDLDRRIKSLQEQIVGVEQAMESLRLAAKGLQESLEPRHGE